MNAIAIIFVSAIAAEGASTGPVDEAAAGVNSSLPECVGDVVRLGYTPIDSWWPSRRELLDRGLPPDTIFRLTGKARVEAVILETGGVSEPVLLSSTASVPGASSDQLAGLLDAKALEIARALRFTPQDLPCRYVIPIFWEQPVDSSQQ